MTAEKTPEPSTATDSQSQPANLPIEFWQTRPELAHVQQFAHSCLMSADALLGSVLARLAAAVPPSVRLPNPVGIEGSLNLAVGLVAQSGVGKSTALGAAALVLPVETHIELDRVPLGSGEGAIDAYFELVQGDEPKVKIKKQTKRRALFVADEGEVLAKQGRRSGSTLPATIRSLATGGHVGQRNASAERTRELAPHTYRAAIVMAIQPLKAGDLLDDADGGTPQRFVWFIGTDPSVPDGAPQRPEPLPWAPPWFTEIPSVMSLDSVAVAEIQAVHLMRVRHGDDAVSLDSHRNLNRLKVAGLLALFSDSAARHISLDDWALAGQVMDASDRCRASIQTELRRQAIELEAQASAKNARRVVAASVATDENAEHRAQLSGAKSIGRKVWREPAAATLTRTDLTRAAGGKHRKLVGIDEMIAEAENQGWIRGDERGWQRASKDPR